jgi:hypothetical protein
MRSELEEKRILLRLTGNMLNTMLEGLSQLDEDVRENIMRKCGEACAKEEFWGPALETAERISGEGDDVQKILGRVNREISWCGEWVLLGDRIESTCKECGCLLVKSGVVTNTDVFCLCSKGWVQVIFETLLKMPVHVNLEKAIGFKDDECKYVVLMEDKMEAQR